MDSHGKEKEELKKKLSKLQTEIDRFKQIQTESVKSKDYEFPKLLYSRHESHSRISQQHVKSNPLLLTSKRNQRYKFERKRIERRNSHSDSELSVVNHKNKKSISVYSKNESIEKSSSFSDFSKFNLSNVKYRYTKYSDTKFNDPKEIIRHALPKLRASPVKQIHHKSNIQCNGKTILSKYKFVRSNGESKPTKSSKARLSHRMKKDYVYRKNNPKSMKILKPNTRLKGFLLMKQNERNKLLNMQTESDNFVSRRLLFIRQHQKNQSIQKTVITRRQLPVMSSNNSSFIARRLLYMRQNSTKKCENKKRIHGRQKTLSSKNKNKKLILVRHGSEYSIAGNLKSLRKVETSKEGKVLKPYMKKGISSKYKLARQLSNHLSNSKTIVARKLVKKNLLKFQKKKTASSSSYCLFYCRFGKCKRGDSCKYIHDPKKVAVCTRFLRGTCKDENCLFSHKVDPKKMPVCSFFLNGECHRDPCPYRHVKVNADAEVCRDFLNGYCSKGDECMLKHILWCEEYSASGKCSKGKLCKLLHIKKKPKSLLTHKVYSSTKKPHAFKRHKTKDGHISVSPMKDKANILPSFVTKKMADKESKVTKSLFTDTNKEVENANQDDSQLVNDTSKILRKSTEDFIPLSMNLSEDDSSSDDDVRKDRRYSFRKQEDFIAL